DGLGGQDRVLHVAGTALLDDVLLFGGGRVRQDVVGVAGGHTHLNVADDDEFRLVLPAQQLDRAIEVAVLVGIGVAAVGPDHLDRDVEFVLALHTVAGGGHLLATFDGLGPSEDRDRGLDGVFVLGVERACHAEVRGAFARAGAAALDADLPDDGCVQEDRAGLILAVGVALRTPALGDGAGLGLGDLACQLDDAVGWNPGDLRCPLWGLLDAVGAIAHDVGAVGGVFRRRVGQGVLVEADGVLVEEL